MKTLKLVLTEKWFDLIEAGKKTSEYRERKPYWFRRLEKDHIHYFNKRNGQPAPAREFDRVEFQRAYKPPVKRITFEIKEISIVDGKETDLNVSAPVYKIDLGPRIYTAGAFERIQNKLTADPDQPLLFKVCPKCGKPHNRQGACCSDKCRRYYHRDKWELKHRAERAAKDKADYRKKVLGK